ncbi:beta-lactamase/transpeptidase-like protein [Schizophyllum amplum]|uniref:Beta-lactamase/transpeptidase-like protein n=1 Tax=Schizophyllum amplum TaxID=97359 RepID=A0A550C3E2_9AGAR|nr:beta-lactamase/transpeptidase-like protein [Auriculariopsis ampla]
MSNKLLDYRVPSVAPPRSSARTIIYSFLILCATLAPAFWAGVLRFDAPYRTSFVAAPSCKVPLPNLLAYSPPTGDEAVTQEASLLLDAYLTERSAHDDIDSMTVAIVTPRGTVFERAYGSLRANESEPDKYGPVDSDSVYRVASITKMFTVLETLILRERGVLNWDDPVTKFLPNFTYSGASWSEHLGGQADSTQPQGPITMRQLASHMSGLGRDYPVQNVPNWPAEIPGSYGFRERPREEVLKAISDLPLVVPQYEYPVYSNAGMDILGIANVEANKLSSDTPDDEPQSHKELIQRDILHPLGLNSSFYVVPSPDIAAHIAVPRKDSEWADIVFGDTDDPAGGQFSSLRDLTTLMKTFLSPTAAGGLISRYVVREWLRPLHPWRDGMNEVGAPWEIRKLSNEMRMYAKGGNLPGYHSQFTLIPEQAFGVILLLAGEYTDTVSLTDVAVARFAPAFAALQTEAAAHAYAGMWRGDSAVVIVAVRDGMLYVDLLVVRGVDVLEAAGAGPGRPVALWSTGRKDEFRLGVGRAELNDVPIAGCEPYWISMDVYGYQSRGAPLDLVYFEDDQLMYPAAGVQLKRL